MKVAIPPWKPTVPASETKSAIRIGVCAGPGVDEFELLASDFYFKLSGLKVTAATRALTITKPTTDEVNELGTRHRRFSIGFLE